MNRRIAGTLLLSLATAFTFLSARTRSVQPPAPVVQGPTFSREVVRIFQQHCQSCHHPGDIGPFSLMSYNDARAWAPLIRIMTQTHQMPPWKPVPGCGEFASARVMTQGEIDTVAAWTENGAPEGDPRDLPPPLDFSGGWALGEPDLVLSSSEPYTPPSSGDMYRCFTMPTQLTSDKYVAAIDIRPGDRATVHHVIAYIDTTGASKNLDDADPGPGYTSFGGPGFTVTDSSASTLGGWAPGSRPVLLPDGVAFKLPAASRIVLQIHYHPHDSKPQPDQTQIGIYYAKVKPTKLMRILPLINQSFTIPPNASEYQVTASAITPVPIHLWLIAPHMHLLGRTMKVEALFADGSKHCLIDINDWDFNWQGMYRFAEPLAIPFISRFDLTSTYDNSANNFRNPNNPPKPVSWGEQTTDEMCIAFLGFTIDSEVLN